MGDDAAGVPAKRCCTQCGDHLLFDLLRFGLGDVLEGRKVAVGEPALDVVFAGGSGFGEAVVLDLDVGEGFLERRDEIFALLNLAVDFLLSLEKNVL